MLLVGTAVSFARDVGGGRLLVCEWASQTHVQRNDGEPTSDDERVSNCLLVASFFFLDGWVVDDAFMWWLLSAGR